MRRAIIQARWLGAVLLAVIVITSGAAAQDGEPNDTGPAAKPAGPSPGSLKSTYTPDPCTGMFNDVPCTPTPHWAANWIEALAIDGVTGGCGGGNYCPDSPVTRAMMAVFLETSMKGTATWDSMREGTESPSGFDLGAATGTTGTGYFFANTQNISSGEESGIYFDDRSALIWAPPIPAILRLYSEDDHKEYFRFGGTPNAIYLVNGEADGPAYIYFYDNGADYNEFFQWDGSTEHRFELSDAFRITDNLVVGTDSVVDYSTFGTPAPNSGDITAASDVFIAGDLELGGNLRLPGQLWVKGHGSGGQDADQTIYFYDDGTSSGEYIGWDDDYVGAGTDDYFVLSNDVRFDEWAPRIVSEDGDLALAIDADADESAYLEVYRDGVFSSTNMLADLDESGNLRIGGTLTQSHSWDIAECFLRAAPVEPGDVVRVDGQRHNAVRRAAAGDGGAVIGVVSANPGVVLGGEPFDPARLDIWGGDLRARFEEARAGLEQEVLAAFPHLTKADPLLDREKQQSVRQRVEREALKLFFARETAPVALSGRVPVKVDGTFGTIEVGDQLTTSPVPGVARKAVSAGPVIGTALEPFDGERGMVMAFVHRGWYAPAAPASTAAADLDQRLARLEALLAATGSHAAPAATASDAEPCLAAGSLQVDPEGNLHATYVPVLEMVGVGDVLVADPTAPGKLRRGKSTADRAVVGIVTRAPGILLGGEIAAMPQVAPELTEQLQRAREQLDAEAEAALWAEIMTRYRTLHAAIALTGTVVDARADAGYGAIAVGDLLTTSPTPGHAMRTDTPEPGTIVAKALEPLSYGTGLIKVLVMQR